VRPYYSSTLHFVQMPCMCVEIRMKPSNCVLRVAWGADCRISSFVCELATTGCSASTDRKTFAADTCSFGCSFPRHRCVREFSIGSPPSFNRFCVLCRPQQFRLSFNVLVLPVAWNTQPLCSALLWVKDFIQHFVNSWHCLCPLQVVLQAISE
jgi:hypothetical protein